MFTFELKTLNLNLKNQVEASKKYKDKNKG